MEGTQNRSPAGPILGRSGGRRSPTTPPPPPRLAHARGSRSERPRRRAPDRSGEEEETERRGRRLQAGRLPRRSWCGRGPPPVPGPPAPAPRLPGPPSAARAPSAAVPGGPGSGGHPPPRAARQSRMQHTKRYGPGSRPRKGAAPFMRARAPRGGAAAPRGRAHYAPGLGAWAIAARPAPAPRPRQLPRRPALRRGPAAPASPAMPGASGVGGGGTFEVGPAAGEAGPPLPPPRRGPLSRAGPFSGGAAQGAARWPGCGPLRGLGLRGSAAELAEGPGPRGGAGALREAAQARRQRKGFRAAAR